MSSSDIAISVRGLSKSYAISHNAQQHSTATEALLSRIKNPFQRASKEIFWALNDVSFEVQRGDVVGVIGRNGAGKSTLLKVLSRITEPTCGEIDLYGRIGSLLEVGTGFHPELTGRENIYLNGAILGMARKEINRQFDEIVDFAGVEQFLDTPVKRYSSGMYVRLAFAVAAHLNPEILIVDEVLAVGDANFQKKCLGKMKDVARSGRTVLFVSHNMQSVSLLCNKGIFMQAGEVTYFGDTKGAMAEYLTSFTLSPQSSRKPESRPGTGEYRFLSVSPSKEIFEGDETKTVNFVLEKRGGEIGSAYLSAHIVNDSGFTVAQCDSRLVGHWFEDTESLQGTFSFESPWLKPGTYRIDMFICTQSAAPLVDKFEDACSLTISPVMPYSNSSGEDAILYGTVLADFEWQTADSRVPRPIIEQDKRQELVS